MIRLVRLLLGFVVIVIVGAFAVANRTPVDVSFAPVPVITEWPVYGVFLLGMVFGGLIGGLIVWFGDFPARREARRMRNRVWALENQLGMVKKQREEAEAMSYGTGRAVAPQAAGGT